MNKTKFLAGTVCIIIITTVFIETLSADPPGWGDDIRLTYANGHSLEPTVVMDSNETIFVVWQDEREGNYDLYLKKSADYGKNWSSDIKITNTSINSGWPRIAMDSTDTLHVLWLEEDESSDGWRPYDNDYKQILYKNSGDGGNTWSSEVQIASNTGKMQQCGLDIAVGMDDVIHVSYSIYPPSNIYYRNSTDDGISWSTPRLIGSDQDCARPTVIEADTLGHVYVAFHIWDNMGDLLFVKSNDNGNTWDSASSLIGGNGWATYSHLDSTDDGFVLLTYCDNLGVGSDSFNDPRDVYIRMSYDYAQTWGSRIRLTDDNYQAYWPITALDSQNNSHVVWYDERDGNQEIYYTKLDFNGTTLIDDTRLTYDPEASSSPVIAIDSDDTRHVFWEDNRISSDNYEIYYKGILLQPVADAGPNQTVYINDEVQFNGSGSFDPDGNITLYEWDCDASDGLWWETGAPPDALGPQPNYTYEGYGVFIATLRVTDNDGFMDTDTCLITVLIPPPQPPTLYINVSLDMKDVILYWDPPLVAGIEHYLIYRSTSQTDFDFTTAWKNTSVDKEIGESTPIPLRTMWNDTNAAYPGNVTNYEEQYYYTIRAVNGLGEVSATSRTVGKWTKTFPSGISTFSLPLEPIDIMPRNTEFYVSHMNASYIKWMNPITHLWIKHGEGEENDAQLEVGRGYVVTFDSQTIYTFCGLPVAMISYDDDSGFSGFDHVTEAASLCVFVEPNGDVNLTWQEPVCMGFGDWYEVYYSNTRDGFFGTPNEDYFPVCPPVSFGSNAITHKGILAINPGSRLYYMVVPFNASGIRGSSTYSIGIWTEEYLPQYDTVGIPLKLSSSKTADWFCDNIPYTVGINYYINGKNRWFWHSTRMPSGSYDIVLVMTEGYQISTSGSTKFTFIGV